MECDPIWPQTKRKERCWWFQITLFFAPIPPEKKIWHIFARLVHIFSMGGSPTDLQHWEFVVIGRGEKHQTPFSSASFEKLPAVGRVLEAVHHHTQMCGINTFIRFLASQKKRNFEIQRTLVLWNIGFFLIFFWFSRCLHGANFFLNSMSHWGVGRRFYPLEWWSDRWRLGIFEVTESWKVSSQRKASWKNNQSAWDFANRNLFVAWNFFQASSYGGSDWSLI